MIFFFTVKYYISSVLYFLFCFNVIIIIINIYIFFYFTIKYYYSSIYNIF